MKSRHLISIMSFFLIFVVFWPALAQKSELSGMDDYLKVVEFSKQYPKLSQQVNSYSLSKISLDELLEFLIQHPNISKYLNHYPNEFSFFLQAIKKHPGSIEVFDKYPWAMKRKFTVIEGQIITNSRRIIDAHLVKWHNSENGNQGVDWEYYRRPIGNDYRRPIDNNEIKKEVLDYKKIFDCNYFIIKDKKNIEYWCFFDEWTRSCSIELGDTVWQNEIESYLQEAKDKKFKVTVEGFKDAGGQIIIMRIKIGDKVFM